MTVQESVDTPRAAQVVSLTATVLALMVGSRQVTLSVFNQLDEVEYEECKPMGRVNPRMDGSWIVGADDKGALVRAQLVRPEFGTEGRFRGWTVISARTAVRNGRHIETEALSELEFFESEMTVWRPLYTSYQALPLIVLAGLR